MGQMGPGCQEKAFGERTVGGEAWSGQKLQGWEAEPHPWEQSVGSALRVRLPSYLPTGARGYQDALLCPDVACLPP